MVEEMEHIGEQEVGLGGARRDHRGIAANQAQINSGVKELETLIIRRFEGMQEVEEEAKRLKEAKESALLGDGSGGKDEEEGDETAGMDPAARRQMRRQRLVDEQRKRIAEEEAEKAEADEQIRSMQAELAKLLEANGRLQKKVEACEHNVDETRAAIEDMKFKSRSASGRRRMRSKC